MTTAEQPWIPETVTESKRRDVLNYVASLDDHEFDSLISEARASSKDAAATRISNILKGKG